MKHLRKYLRDPAMIARRILWNRERRRATGEHLTVDSWNGRLTMNRQDGFIAKGIYVRRAYEKETILTAVELLRELGHNTNRDTLLDVGANLGMICIAFVRHGFCKQAIAVEPAPENFALLEHNIHQNKLADRIAAHQLALSDKPGTLTMELDPLNFGANRVLTAEQIRRATDRQRVEVPALSFDDFVSRGQCDPERLALIWMDIEGHEAKFFRGAKLLASSRTPVVMEFSPVFMKGSGVPPAEYLAILQEYAGEFYDLRRRRPVRQSASELPELFTSLDEPGKVLATDLLLLPRSR